MGPSRKRQRLSEDGTAAITAVADSEQPTNPTSTAEETASSAKQDIRKQLFVRSLAPTVTTEDLTEYFSESYPIKHALVVLDRQTKESKGYGFVTFADAEDALRAKEELDGTELKGKKIWVDVAEARHRGDTKLDVSGLKGVPTAATKAKLDREQQKKQDPTPKLIVRNLPWSIKKPEQLEKLFLSYGKVHFVTLPKKPTGELKGFGFVALRGRKNAEKAMQELNGKQIGGRPIAVDWAVDKDTWQQLQKQEENTDGDAEDVEGAEDSDENSASGSDEDSDEDADSDSDSDEDSDDLEDISEDDEEEGGVGLEDEEESKPKRQEYTVFVRNLPFTADDETLEDHFTENFGRTRFARIVVDRETEKPKGTGFVCFVKEEDMIDCLKNAPRVKLQKSTSERKDGTTVIVTHSVLEDEEADPTGRYTLDGRVLQISRAVDRNEATRLTAEGHEARFNRDKDKRHLYLLSEGTIPSNSPLYQKLAPSEIKMRQESSDMRKKQIQTNPSLHLSLTRLSIRNIPRSVTSKDLKDLARKAVVGFAEDVRNGKRERLSKEELSRGGEAMLIAEKIRKKRGKGIVKQAKVVFETPAGSKVDEKTGAGRSRGYGFIEYYTHRNALMGLRYLNGHAVEYQAKETGKGKKAAQASAEDRKKRLIVEFAIENANVVARRSDRENKARENPKGEGDHDDADDGEGRRTNDSGRRGGKGKAAGSGKRKRDEDSSAGLSRKKGKSSGTDGGAADGRDAGAVSAAGKAGDKLAKQSRIIAQKRMKRRAKKAGKA
ncbi:hypothetical protein BS50DRAFT_578242 [Corynespora cassiicola Philippines]|uniref:RRM domain-containing protein n=1 Tax=Corynespora cassiicola Philippines TaxID=1448308 RepID=A0A2T2N8F4_CORCC|nr:hypothetical protein BS50DRAFT_578242 [Corynespora cassiicola Philippines]